MTDRRLVFFGMAALVAAGAGLGYAVRGARAAIPKSQVLTYSGVLTDNAGAPLAGSRNIQFQLWDMEKGGTAPLCTMDPMAITLAGGGFQIGLTDACVDAFHKSGDVWIGIIVNGEALPRTKTGAVPYALEADHATRSDVAGTANAAGGALKTAIDGLTGPPTVIEVRDARTGGGNCPPTTGVADQELMVLNFTATKNTVARFNADIIKNGLGRADLNLLVDGKIMSRALTGQAPAPSEWSPAHVEWAGVVPAGAHKVSVVGTGLNVWGCGAEWGALRAIIYQ